MSGRVLAFVSVALMLFVPVAMGAGLADSDWPCFKGNPQRTGLSEYAFGDNPGKENWRKSTGIAFYVSPVILPNGDIVAVGSMHAYAYDAQGSQVWYSEWQGSDAGNIAVTDDGRLVYSQDDYSMTALDFSGNEVWKYPMAHDTYSSPLVGNDGTLYFGTMDYEMWNATLGDYKWDSSFIAMSGDGTVRWNITMEYGILSSPALGTGNAIYITSGEHLYAFSLNGNFLWSAPMDGSVGGCTPTVASDGSIYVTDYVGHLYRFSSTGARLARYDLQSYETGHLALGPDGTVYLGSSEGMLHAFTADLALKWTFATGGYIDGPPTVTSDHVILIGSHDGFLYAIDSTGNEIWSFEVGAWIAWSPIISSDGTIYLTSYDGCLYSIGEGADSGDPFGEEETDYLPCCGLFYLPPVAGLGILSGTFMLIRRPERFED